MPETPFDLYRTERGWVAENQSHAVTVVSEIPCRMGRRRGMRMTPHGGDMAEMAAVELPDGIRVYVRQLENGHVDVTITRRVLNP